MDVSDSLRLADEQSGWMAVSHHTDAIWHGSQEWAGYTLVPRSNNPMEGTSTMRFRSRSQSSILRSTSCPIRSDVNTSPSLRPILRRFVQAADRAEGSVEVEARRKTEATGWWLSKCSFGGVSRRSGSEYISGNETDQVDSERKMRNIERKKSGSEDVETEMRVVTAM